MSESSEKLAVIVRVSQIASIPDADKIVCARMEDNAWQVVVPKDAFVVGDLGVFFVIDSVVDSTNPALAFMAARKSLVWNVRMKKCLSQGLLVPISALAYWGVDPATVKQGDDVTTATKTTKRTREEDLPNNPQASGVFPSHIASQTDELNLLSYKAAFQEFLGEKAYISLKCDGSSSFFYHDEERVFHACSRRQKLKPDADNAWNRLAKKYNLSEVLKGTTLGVFGEACGPKLNGNKMGLTQEDLFVFDVWDYKNRRYFSLDELSQFCALNSLKQAKVLWRGEFNWSDIQSLVEYSSELKYDSNGESAEGLVLRLSHHSYSDILGKRLSVKVINPNYKQ